MFYTTAANRHRTIVNKIYIYDFDILNRSSVFNTYLIAKYFIYEISKPAKIDILILYSKHSLA